MQVEEGPSDSTFEVEACTESPDDATSYSYSDFSSTINSSYIDSSDVSMDVVLRPKTLEPTVVHTSSELKDDSLMQSPLQPTRFSHTMREVCPKMRLLLLMFMMQAPDIGKTC